MSRLEELLAKDSKTDAEMREMVSLLPPGSMHQMNLAVAGPTSLDQALKNALHGIGQIEKARKAGFVIEAIALRSQFLELLLRLFLGGKTAIKVDPNDRRPLGALIKEATKMGLPAEIIDRLTTFNRDRKLSLHHYFLGAVLYEEIAKVLASSDGLAPNLADVVFKACGEEVR